METIERWGMFEVSLPGRSDGNPFTDYNISGVFRHEQETVFAYADHDENIEV